MASPITLGEYIGRKVREAVTGAIQDAKGDLTDIARAGGREASDSLIGELGSITEVLGFVVEALSALDGPVLLAWEAIKNVEKAAGRQGRSYGFGWVLGSIGFQLAEPVTRWVAQHVEELFTTQILDPATAATLVAKGIWPPQHGFDEAARSGVDQSRMDALIRSANDHPAIAELLQLLNLGQATHDDVRGALKRHGLADEWIERVIELRRYLLSPADLALALLRENVDEKTAYEYGAQLGIDRNDLALLVENTGEPPGLMQMLEAYRRGIIDLPRLERGIRQSRVRTEWKDVVEALRYEPMTTADAVRAVVESYLTPEQGAKIADENGLRPDHWKYLLESWGRPLAHEQMMTLFYRGQATLDQVRQAMRESDLKDKYIEQSIQLGRRMLPIRLVLDAVKGGILTEQQGASQLLQQGYSRDDALIIMRLGISEQKHAHKELSRQQIATMYEEGMIGRDAAQADLVALGYSTHDAAALLNLADRQQHAKQLRGDVNAVRASFLSGRLDNVAAEAQLTRLGQTVDQARALISTWSREHGRGSRTLTEPQIIKAAGYQTISPATAVSMLKGLGFTEQDALILLHSNGIDIPTPHSTGGLGGGGGTGG